MARVLLLDADAATRAELQDVIAGAGHEVIPAADPSEALAVAGSSGVDLVVSDVRLEGTPAFELRKKLRRTLAFPVPFVFLSSDVERDGKEILELAKVEYLFLFRKPLDQPKFVRTVGALIGSEQLVEGRFGDAALDAMLASIERGEESGVLTAYRGTIVKKVAFEDGQVTFCGSNDPRERIGQALTKAGVITEDDLVQALGLHEGSVSSLTSILEKLGKATSAQIDEVLTRKVREGVLDLYLWQEGKWVFQAGVLAVGNPSRIRLPLGPLRAEGAKRAPRWKAVVAMLPDDEVRFEVRKEKFAPGFPANAGDKKLVELAAKGLPLGRIRLELAGQDYAVMVRLSELLKAGALEKTGIPGPGPMEADLLAERAALAASAVRSSGVKFRPAAPVKEEPSGSIRTPAAPPPRPESPPPPLDAPPPPPGAPPPPELVLEPLPDPDDPVAALLHEAETHAAVRDVLGAVAPGFAAGKAVETLMEAARKALEANDLDKAGRTFQAILKVDPAHALARRGLAQVDAHIARRAEGAGLLRNARIRVAIPRERLASLDLEAEAAFVMSRLDETPSPVDDLLLVCPMPEAALLDLLRRFLVEGWIAVS